MDRAPEYLCISAIVKRGYFFDHYCTHSREIMSLISKLHTTGEQLMFLHLTHHKYYWGSCTIWFHPDPHVMRYWMFLGCFSIPQSVHKNISCAHLAPASIVVSGIDINYITSPSGVQIRNVSGERGRYNPIMAFGGNPIIIPILRDMYYMCSSH